jgi:uncharacterized protein (DUF1800 family)
MEPALNESNVRHLLRRTEFVDRPHRVAELLGTGSIAAAVQNVMAVQASPPSVSFVTSNDWERGGEYTHFWLDRMAHDSPRPLQERMSFFWHGHFCSEFGKVNSSALMRDQIDLFRTQGFGNVRALARAMSVQVAMIRYLDNNENRASSPNQNFARELMELFLLGVGNYTEADVEAATAAWTGHSDQWNDTVNPYRWRPEWHDGRIKSFLGRTINDGGDPKGHGPETIDVMLGTGVVPAAATNAANRGRPTREVAAEFLSRKLWTFFATDSPPPADVAAAMRDALVSGNFEIRPWLTAMLTHPAFYTDAVKRGLVRSPVDYTVALLVATGLRSKQANIVWNMDAMGQRPLFPPNVSGWRPNGYWVNASAMGGRARTAQGLAWTVGKNYWDTNGVITLAAGTISRAEITATKNGVPVLSSADLVDKLLTLMRLRLSDAARSEIIRYADGAAVWERNDAVLLIMAAPEMHLA